MSQQRASRRAESPRVALAVRALAGTATAMLLATCAMLPSGAFNEPRSGATAHGEIRLPDAGCPSARFVVRDGETLRVQHGPSGRAFGFVLALDEQDPGRATWIPVSLETASSLDRAQLAGVPRTTQVGLLESFELPAAEASGHIFRFELQLLGSGAGANGQATGGAGTGDECCVTCDDWTVCGSCVDLWCASCCGGSGGVSDIAPANRGGRP